MTGDEDPVPLEACALPGTLTVTQAALDLAEQFQAAVPAGWIVAFSWHDGERIRANKDAPWEDKGPGMGLGAYQSHDIPQQALWHSGSLRYAVLVREEIIASHPQKTIDVDEARKIVLR